MTTSATSIERSNFHHLVMDVAWFGLALAATSRFLQFYALRLGATPMELGWLTALPSIVLIFSTAFSSRWRMRYADSYHAIWWPSIAYRFVFLLPAFAPFFPEQWRTVWIILAAMIPAIPQGINASIFLTMMREAVDESSLMPLFARRTVIMNVTVTIGAIVFGLLLEMLPFPTNYQVMFVVAFAFSFVSQWHLSRLKSPAVTIVLPEAASKPQKSLRELLKTSEFQSVAFISLIGHIAFFSVFAVTPLRLEHDLGATEGFMALFGVAELVAGAITAMYIERISRRLGNRTMIAWGLVGTALAAFIIAVAREQNITLLASAISGSTWTMVGVGTLQFYAERTHKDDIKAATTFHQIIFLAIFIGPLLGSSLANAGISLVWIMLGGAAVRLLAGWLTHTGLSILPNRSRIEPLKPRHQHTS